MKLKQRCRQIIVLKSDMLSLPIWKPKRVSWIHLHMNSSPIILRWRRNQGEKTHSKNWSMPQNIQIKYLVSLVLYNPRRRRLWKASPHTSEVAARQYRKPSQICVGVAQFEMTNAQSQCILCHNSGARRTTFTRMGMIRSPLRWENNTCVVLKKKATAMMSPREPVSNAINTNHYCIMKWRATRIYTQL